MPCAMRPPNGVWLPNSSSKCSGLRSVEASPKSSIVRSSTENSCTARCPTAIAMASGYCDLSDTAADGGRTRQTRPARAGSPHLGHRPLQLPLRLLHAQGGLRQAVRVPAPRAAADVRGDRAADAHVRRHGRREAAHHGRRAARAPRRRRADRAPRGSPRHPRRHADDERLAAGAHGPAPGGCGSEPRDGLARLARRRDVPRDERRRLPGRRRARGHRRGARRRARAGQGQHGRQARHERRRHPRDGRALPRQRA